MDQPSAPPPHPTPAPRPIVLQLPHLSRRALSLTGAGLLCAGVLAAGAIWYLRENTAAVGIPHSLTREVNFPLYLPHHPPTGFKLKDNSFDATAQVFTYSYMYQDTKTIAVSIQPISDDISTTSFHPTKSFTTAIGKAYLVNLDIRTTAAIITDKSFILINAPDPIPMAAMEDFVNSFRPSR
jgi:hypothetical protein